MPALRRESRIPRNADLLSSALVFGAPVIRFRADGGCYRCCIICIELVLPASTLLPLCGVDVEKPALHILRTVESLPLSTLHIVQERMNIRLLQMRWGRGRRHGPTGRGRCAVGDIFVIQTINGQERHVRNLIERMVGQPLVEECFFPTYMVKKSYKRTWRLVEKKLTPGYLYLVTADIERVASALRDVPAFTRLLGTNGSFTPLRSDEVAWVNALTKVGHRVIDLSQGIIEHDKVIVQSGPLCGLEGMIRKIDRHKRLATLEIHILGRTKTIRVGLEIVAKTF